MEQQQQQHRFPFHLEPSGKFNTLNRKLSTRQPKKHLGPPKIETTFPIRENPS
jgi:hypothetical protein